MKGFGTRALSGVLLLGLVALSIWLRGPLLMVGVAAAAAIAAHEFYTMARKAGYAPWYPAGVALAILLALRGYLGDITSGEVSPQVLAGAEVLSVSLVMAALLVRQGQSWLQAAPAETPGAAARGRNSSVAWADMGLTLAGALYTGGLLGYAPIMGGTSAPGAVDGRLWLFLVILGTAACDTGAYLAGSSFGRHKMIPHISPGKTWEGIAGGTAAAVLASLALSGLLHFSVLQAILLGLLICAAAVLGDLCESLLKRASGVKDSGQLIPGHGGLLDRLDSILFVILAVYWFARVTAG